MTVKHFTKNSETVVVAPDCNFTLDRSPNSHFNAENKCFIASLPLELVLLIARNLLVWDYLSLRNTCSYFANLPVYPALSFDAYRNSIRLFPYCSRHLLITHHMLRLDIQASDNLHPVATFLAQRCHHFEFIKLIDRMSTETLVASLEILVHKDMETHTMFEGAGHPRHEATRLIVGYMVKRPKVLLNCRNMLVSWAYMRGSTEIVRMITESMDRMDGMN